MRIHVLRPEVSLCVEAFKEKERSGSKESKKITMRDDYAQLTENPKTKRKKIIVNTSPFAKMN